MITAADFGVSMIVAPAYIISLKSGVLTFGQSEYIVQGALFILFCILMKKVKLVYFSSFATGIIYGAVLDLWRTVIPPFNPEITPPGSMALGIRITYLALGMVMTSFSIALFFRTYFLPQVYDFFVKGISAHFNLDRNKFKIGFDIIFLLISACVSLILFKGFKGIGTGTVVMTAFNGVLIGMFGKMFDKAIDFKPLFKNFSERFRLD